MDVVIPPQVSTWFIAILHRCRPARLSLGRRVRLLASSSYEPEGGSDVGSLVPCVPTTYRSASPNRLASSGSGGDRREPPRHCGRGFCLEFGGTYQAC